MLPSKGMTWTATSTQMRDKNNRYLERRYVSNMSCYISAEISIGSKYRPVLKKAQSNSKRTCVEAHFHIIEVSVIFYF